MSVRRRLNNFLEVAKTEGVMDALYEQTKRDLAADDPKFMANLIAVFLRDGDSNIINLSELLDEDDVDFYKVTRCTHQLKGASASIGGCRLAAVCCSLKEASDNEDSERCIELYDRVATEYEIFRNKIRTIYQMEREIATTEVIPNNEVIANNEVITNNEAHGRE